jgi:hypothetical protein
VDQGTCDVEKERGFDVYTNFSFESVDIFKSGMILYSLGIEDKYLMRRLGLFLSLLAVK